jgi:hypothetical protein
MYGGAGALPSKSCKMKMTAKVPSDMPALRGFLFLQKELAT